MPRRLSKMPPGFYSPGVAMAKLGITDRNFLQSLVRSHRLTPYMLPGRKIAMYRQSEVESLAEEIQLFLLESAEEDTMEFRQATRDDIPGIVNVLRSLNWPTISPSERARRYDSNDRMDYIVVRMGQVLGYVNLVSYPEETLWDMMAGRKHSWHLRPSDFLPFVPRDEPYDLFVGLAEREDMSKSDAARCGYKLILGIFGREGILAEWARTGIRIRRMYGSSAEEDGKKTARMLGFEQLPREEGDAPEWERFVLDLEVSDHPFARRYREIVKQVKSH